MPDRSLEETARGFYDERRRATWRISVVSSRRPARSTAKDARCPNARVRTRPAVDKVTCTEQLMCHLECLNGMSDKITSTRSMSRANRAREANIRYSVYARI
jgi:hypothetical protein